MTEEEILEFADAQLRTRGLKNEGWTIEIKDSCDGHYFGYTNFETKTIEIYRQHWPTLDRNIKETIKHEVAHVLCGHGEHTLDWWDKLIDIGGRGIWVMDEARIKSIGVSVVY